LKTLIVVPICALMLVSAMIATPLLHDNYARWQESQAIYKTKADNARLAYGKCQNVNSTATKTFKEADEICGETWVQWRDLNENYKKNTWLNFLFAGK
jgi:hypothetical protein